MAIYKPSNHVPNLSEINFLQPNMFSCMVNTSGENVVAYKPTILSSRGDKKIFIPDIPTVLDIPIKNKGTMNIPIAEKIGLNGKDYQWGVRVYNDVPYSEKVPNTLVCDGFLVGSTKNVIWCKIPDQDGETNKKAVEQIVYDRYIEFNTTKEQMILGAKDDPTHVLPDTSQKNFIQREKIDWVTKELGYNKNFLKIETEKPLDYNYINGVPFKIYKCNSNHTVKSFFADPNPEVNVSNFVVVFESAEKAQAAHDAGYSPEKEVVVNGIVYKPRKITGYSSDTGEVRVMDAFDEPPKNGQAYMLFEFDYLNKTYNEREPKKGADGNLDYKTQTIGGQPLESNLYKVITNAVEPNLQLFVQPNINIKPDKTNPDEFVFDNGARLNLEEQYYIEKTSKEKIDITFDQLDNTQWLITTDSKDKDGISKNESGKVPNIVQKEGGPVILPPIMPQSDYKVYTCFMDSTPYNVFYARDEMILSLQYKDLNKSSDSFVDFDSEEFKKEITNLLINKEGYEEIRQQVEVQDPPVPIEKAIREKIPTFQKSNYYDGTLVLMGHIMEASFQAAGGSFSPEQMEEQIAILVSSYEETGIPLRNIQFNTQIKSSNGQGIKYYNYALYAYNGLKKELIEKTEDIYSSELIWYYRGLSTGVKYGIAVSVCDEYGKTFEKAVDFNCFYGVETTSIPLGIEFNCEKKAMQITATSPEIVSPGIEETTYLTQTQLDEKWGQLNDGQICIFIKEDENPSANGVTFQGETYSFNIYYQFKIYNEAGIVKYKFSPSSILPITIDNLKNNDEVIYDDYIVIPQEKKLYYDTVQNGNYPNDKISIPVNFSILSQFQLTKEFINQIPLTPDNQKIKVLSFGYERFDTDKYKINCQVIDKNTEIINPSEKDIYHFLYEKYYNGIRYEAGYYKYKYYENKDNGYFVNIIINTIYDIPNATFLKDAYYFFPYNEKGKGHYYDGNYYSGYYLWGDGKNNSFSHLDLYLNSCKSFNYIKNSIIVNKKRCWLEIYDENNALPLKCFVVGKNKDGTDILSDHISLLELGGDLPAPKGYKYAIQDNSQNMYYFANNLQPPEAVEQVSKYRIYGLTSEDIAKYTSQGLEVPTEDKNGRPYGVYRWLPQYSTWVIDNTEYVYIENLDLLDGVAYDANIPLKDKYDALSVPLNCRSNLTSEQEIVFENDSEKKQLIAKNKPGYEDYNDPSFNFNPSEKMGELKDDKTKEDNWSFKSIPNKIDTYIGSISVKRKGDLLWTDGNEQVYNYLPLSPQSGIVYQLIQSKDSNYKDGYYVFIDNSWKINNYDIDSAPQGRPNHNNVWVDNSAYTYKQIVQSVSKQWITFYGNITYDEYSPIKITMLMQEKWEG